LLVYVENICIFTKTNKSKQMNKVKIKSYKVDGETRVGIWVNNVWKWEVDCNSQYSVREAKENLMDLYRQGHYQ
jgi:hypothetical protein